MTSPRQHAFDIGSHQIVKSGASCAEPVGPTLGMNLTLAQQMVTLSEKLAAIYEAQLGQKLQKEKKPKFEEPKFPMSSLEEFGDLEDKLQDPKFRRFVVGIVALKGSTNDPGKTVSEVLHATLRKAVAICYSWIGRKGKRPFSHTRFFGVVRDGVRSRFSRTGPVDDAIIKLRMQAFFKYASDMENGRSMRSVRTASSAPASTTASQRALSSASATATAPELAGSSLSATAPIRTGSSVAANNTASQRARPSASATATVPERAGSSLSATAPIRTGSSVAANNTASQRARSSASATDTASGSTGSGSFEDDDDEEDKYEDGNDESEDEDGDDESENEDGDDESEDEDGGDESEDEEGEDKV